MVSKAAEVEWEDWMRDVRVRSKEGKEEVESDVSENASVAVVERR